MAKLNRSEMLEQLREKLNHSLDEFMAEFFPKSPLTIWDKALELEATRVMYNELYFDGDRCSDNLLERLLEFEDPLAAARDQWIEEYYAPSMKEIFRKLQLETLPWTDYSVVFEKMKAEGYTESEIFSKLRVEKLRAESRTNDYAKDHGTAIAVAINALAYPIYSEPSKIVDLLRDVGIPESVIKYAHNLCIPKSVIEDAGEIELKAR
ncbi:MAG: hypothetical protein LBK56_04595 [Gracilibacteraceae bacterium]|jgi:hypothetical protein|nr:hypothetical protein [Gracilibacteraceae bacterium]